MEGKKSHMTFEFRHWKLGFEWDCLCAAWDERLKELADYRKIQHSMSPTTTVKTPNWGWVEITGCTWKERHRL
jgi:hypothetical protein